MQRGESFDGVDVGDSGAAELVILLSSSCAIKSSRAYYMDKVQSGDHASVWKAHVQLVIKRHDVNLIPP